MALVNPSILAQLQQPQQTPVQALQGGMQLGDQMRQNQQQQAGYNRQQAFMQALDEAVKGVDYTKPEGQQAIIQNLSQKGFGREAFDLAKQFPKPPAPSFSSTPTNQGLRAFNSQTGEYGPPAVGSDGKPLFDEATATKMQTAEDKKAAAEADFNFGKSINGYTKELAGIGMDMTKRDLLASKIMQEHPNSQKAEKYIDKVVKADSPMMGIMGQRMTIGSMSDWRPVRAEYEKQSKAYVQAEGIVKSAMFGKNQIGDVSLLNQLAQAETGSKPTDAEYKQLEHSPGPMGKIAQAYNTVKNGNLLKPDVVKSIMAEFRSQQSIRQEAYAASIKEKQDEAKQNGVNPGIITPGGIYQQVEKLKSNWDEGKAPVSAASTMPTHEQYDSLPSGAEFTDPNGNVRRKP